jgi:hypothetical protein
MAAFVLYQMVTNYTPPDAISEDSFNVDIFNASIDLAGYLACGLIFGKILHRKKFIFSISYVISLIGAVGIFLTAKATIEPNLTLSYVSKAIG